MRLRHIQVLVTVAETGSIRAAARKLGLTQPALSKAIRQMEGDFKVQMLTRTPRGVVLTDYGRAVLTRARSIDAEIKRMEEEVAQLRGNMHGSVCVAVAPLPSLLILPYVLPRYCSTHPDVDVRILDGMYPTVLPHVREGAYDFVVGPAPHEGLVGDLEAEELMETELVVAGRFNHPKAKASRLAELTSAKWMTMGPAGSPGDHFVNAFAAQGLAAPTATVKSESFASSLALIEASDFLSILPKRLISQFERQQRLQAIAICEQLPVVKVVLLRRAGVPLTPAAEALATLIRRRANAISRTKGGA